MTEIAEKTPWHREPFVWLLIAIPLTAVIVGFVGLGRGRIGAVTVTTLVALLPELGNRNAKEIAALAGLAPINCDSGTIRGQRHVTGGRRRVRRALYMAALAVIRYVPKFKMYYQTIKQRSGHAKVALIAVARKLLVILNAMPQSGTPLKPTHAP